MNLFGGQEARNEHAYVEYANARVAECLSSEKDSPDLATTQAPSDTKKRSIEPSECKDLTHYGARDPLPNHPFTLVDLHTESSLLIAAGADTTSTVPAASFFYLTPPSSTSILRKVQSQLRSTFPDVHSIRSLAITSPKSPLPPSHNRRVPPPRPSALPRQSPHTSHPLSSHLPA
jgi:hypothetical protein